MTNRGGSGGGGAGGGGALLNGAINFTNTGSMTGGNGGAVDILAFTTIGPGASGGDGGMGVALIGGGGIDNRINGVIAGGAGGGCPTLTAGTLAGSAASFGSGPIANDAALRIDQPVDATLANTVSGSGAVAKTGAGTLTLTGTNTYAGGTSLSAGILAGSASSFGSGPIANDAVLHIDQPVDATLANTVSGSGAVAKTGAGTLTLTGTNSYAGGTTVSAGTLAGSAASFAILDLAGFNQSIAALSNAGTVSLVGSAPGTSLYGEVGKLWATSSDTRVKSQLNASAGLRLRW